MKNHGLRESTSSYTAYILLWTEGDSVWFLAPKKPQRATRVTRGDHPTVKFPICGLSQQLGHESTYIYLEVVII